MAHGTTDSEQDALPGPFLQWPPPGLERMQGDLWRVAARGALSGGLLVLPLLLVVAREEELASLGPFADAWWVTLVLATVGLGFATDALASTGRILARVSRSLDQGYDLHTVGLVLADVRGDMGFLLQGGHHFAVLEVRERQTIARLRVAAVCFHAAAGLWLPLALATGLLLAARGLIGPQTLWLSTLSPAAVFYVFGGAAGAVEDARVRRARGAWHRQPWASDLVTDEIRSWRDRFAAPSENDAAAVPASAGPLLRRLSLVLGALAVFVALPVLTLVPSAAIGPVLAMVGIPSFTQIQLRAAQSEALRPYVLPPDADMSAEEAGILLQDLLFVGPDRVVGDAQLAPSRRIEQPWMPRLSGRSPVGAEPHRWSEVVFGLVMADPSTDLLAYVALVADHPGHDDLSRLARAPELDAAFGRWPNPFPPGMTMGELPIPRFDALRTGAFAHVGAAAHELSQGNPRRAEEMLREVISVGLLVGDQGPTVIENVIGYSIARGGFDALEAFYDATGRSSDAERVRELDRIASTAVRRIRPRPIQGVEAFVRSMPPMVVDTTAVRGLRWEYFALTTTLTPCLNLNRMVFGPDEACHQFVEDAHDALVRWPSEEALFEVAKGGYLARPNVGSPSWIGRLLSISMRSGEGACGEVVRRLRAVEC